MTQPLWISNEQVKVSGTCPACDNPRFSVKAFATTEAMDGDSVYAFCCSFYGEVIEIDEGGLFAEWCLEVETCACRICTRNAERELELPL